MRIHLKRTLWIPMIVAVLATLCLASNAEAWWDTHYLYRKQITITNNSGGTVSVDTLVSFTTDTESLINDNKLRSDGNDWRIVYDNGSTETEIGQKIENGWDTTSTETWFRLEAEIGNGASDSDYYVYHGYSDESTSAASLDPAQDTDNIVYSVINGGGNGSSLAFDADDSNEWGHMQGFDFNEYYDCWWNITKFDYYVTVRAGGTSESLAGFIFDGIDKGEGEEITNGKGDLFTNDSINTYNWNTATFSPPYPKVKELTTFYAGILPTNPVDRTASGGGDYIRWDYSPNDADGSNQGYHTNRGASSWLTGGFSVSGADFLIKIHADEASNDDLSASLGDQSAILFQDDFEDGVVTGWTKVYGANPTESGGVFTIASNTDTHFRVTDGLSWTDYTFSAKVKGVDNDRSGISFRAQNDTQGSGDYNYYVFQQEFGGTGGTTWTLKLQKVVNGTPSDLATLDNYGSNPGQVDSKTTFYTFKVVVSGTSIKCYIDDILKFDITDSTYLSGTVGLWTEAQDGGTFDDVLVTGIITTAIYYSVGTDGSDLYSSTAWALDGVMTLTSEAALNIGVGDEVQWGANRYYISGRNSSTEFTIQNSKANGGVPGDTNISFGSESVPESIIIKRAFSGPSALSDAEARIRSNTYNYLKTGELVNGNYQLNLACYADGDMDDNVTIGQNNWETGPYNYIRIYTPTSTSEVGESQRHNGTWGTGFRLTPSSGSAIEVQADYVRIEGITIRSASSGACFSISGISANNDVRISHCLLVGQGAVNSRGIIAGDPDLNLTVWNSIAYNHGNQQGFYVYDCTTAYFYNCTAYNNNSGFYQAGTVPLVIKNCISIGNNGWDYVGTFDSSSDYNMSGTISGSDFRQAPGFTIDSGTTAAGTNTTTVKLDDTTGISAGDWFNNTTQKGSSKIKSVDDSTTLTLSEAIDSQTNGDSYWVKHSAWFCSPSNNFVDIDTGEEDLHLKSGADAIDAGINLSSTFIDDIDGETHSGTWDIGADESATAIYYSVGTETQALYSDTASASSGVLTLDSPAVAKIGVGDEVRVGSNRYYITGRNSEYEFTIQNSGAPAGAGTPGDTNISFGPSTSITIYRAFNLLSTAVSNSLDSDHLKTSNLVDNNYQLNWPCYNDNDEPMDDTPSVTGWTTGPYHYIRIFAPFRADEVGASQRHTGIEGTGFRLKPTSPPASALLLIDEEYVRVEGIEIDGSNLAPTLSGILTNHTLATTSDVRIDGCIVHDLHASSGSGFHTGIFINGTGTPAPGTGATARISNNIVYDITSPNYHVLGIVVSSATTSYVYNNTVYHIRQHSTVQNGAAWGIAARTNGTWTATVEAKNNYVGDVIADSDPVFLCYDGTNTPLNQQTNVSSDGTGTITGKSGYASYFANATIGSENLHLQNDSNALWGSYGTDLDSDPNLPITDDIDGEARDASAPDIGADEFQAGLSLTLANHNPAGQVEDKFTTTISVTDILYRFNLTRSGTVTVSNIRVNYTTGSGIDDGDVTAGALYRDENNDGGVDGGDTALQTGINGFGGQLAFTLLNESPGTSGTNYLVQVTVSNLAAGETTTFSLGAADIDEVQGGVAEPGSINDATHTQDSAGGGGLDAKVGIFDENQTAVTVGFQPKAVLFWITDRTSTGAGPYARFGRGWTDGTNQGAIATAWEDGAPDTANQDNRDRVVNTACITLIDHTATDGTEILAEASIGSFTSTGFTLTWIQSTGTRKVVYLALGGDALTDVKAGSFLTEWCTPDPCDKVGQTKPIADVGFQPDAVFLAGIENGDTPSDGFFDTSTRGGHGFGIALSSTNRHSNGHRWRDAKDATLDSSSGINDEVALVYADNSTIPEIAFDLYSMDATGFTLDWAQGGDHGTAVIYLALKGIDIDRGILDQRTGTTGTQTVSGLTFEPTAILFDGGDKDWTDPLDPPPWSSGYAGFEQPAEASVGVADSTTQAGIWIGSAGPRSSDSALSTSDVILSYTAGSPTLNAKAQLSSINSDGFTLNWTDVDSTARKIGWVALGPACGPTTTLGDGTDPGNSTVAPGSADQYLDQFTFVTNGNSDSVTALTVTTTNTDAIASMEIWNDGGGTQYFSTVSSPSGDTWNFSGPTAIPVTDSPASFRVRFTAKDHTTLPNPIEYPVTGTVTAFTCTNSQAGTDTDSATITVDNDPPDDATWGTITPGDQQVVLNWTNPGSDFNKVLILRRADSAVGDTPTEGTEYNVDDPIGSSTVRYVGSLETFTDTGLTNGTDYYYKIFAYDGYINYATGTGTGPHTPDATTTLGDGTDPGNSTVPPGSADQYLDQFTFVTSSGSDSVDTLTVTTANTDAIASMEIWNDALSTQYFSTVSSPSGDTWNFSGAPIPVTDSPASFRVRFTAKDHATLPNPIEYPVTGTVTAFTCTNAQAGTDTDSATITVDNDPPDDATWGTITPGDQQVVLNWTNPVSDFYKVLILRRADSAVGDTPIEGTEYNVDDPIGSSTVRYVGSLETFTDTGLTNETDYYYKIFAYDAYINYATGTGTGPHTPDATTTLGDGTDPGNSTVAPGSADQYLDQFTFITSSGSDSVDTLTVTTANTDAIASMEIWNDAGDTQYFSTVSSPSGDTWNFSGGTAIPVTDSPASFRVRFTAKDHATLPNPIEYPVTGTVTAFTCTNAQAGTDTDSATITVDNDPPDDATWGTITPGDQQVVLNWTNPVSDFYKVLILRRADSAVGDTPIEGTEYNVDDPIGSSTVRYVGSLETFTDTGLTNETDYYYKIFAYDAYINYATGTGTGPHTPDTGYLEQIRYRWRNDDGAESATLDTGTGADGPVTISGTENINIDLGGTLTTVSSFAQASGGTDLTVASVSGLSAGDEVLLINLQGDSTNNGNVGNYEFLEIDAINGTTLTCKTPIQNIYGMTTSNLDLTGQKVIVQRVPQWTNVTVTSTGTLTANGWDGSKGGVIVFRATGTVTVESGGKIDAEGLGYRGGPEHGGSAGGAYWRYKGEGYKGGYSTEGDGANSEGGGPGYTDGNDGCGDPPIYDGVGGGGGGGYGTSGVDGENTIVCVPCGEPGCEDTQTYNGGVAGGTYGDTALNDLFVGSGGGSGGYDTGSSGRYGGEGGAGGGIIYIIAHTISVSGTISNNGAPGLTPINGCGGGGGSGGSILLQAYSATLGDTKVTATGGLGGLGDGGKPNGGAGGDGRIRVEADDKTGTVATDPAYTESGTPDTEGSGATFMAGENIPISDLGKSTTVRLRVEVSNEGTEDSTPIQYRLEYAESTSGPWITVPASATNQHWQMSDSGYFSDGYPTSDIDDQYSNPALTNENAGFVPGELKDATATTTGSIALSTTQFTEIEYSIEATNNADDGQTYYFRLVDPSSTYTITYSVYPEVTLIEPVVWVSTTSSTITVETPQIKMVFDEAQGAGLDYLYGKTENNASTGRGGDRANYNVWSTWIDDGTQHFENGTGTLTLLEFSPARVKIRQQFDYTTDHHLDRMWTIYPSNKIAIEEELTFDSTQSIIGATGFHGNASNFFSAGISDQTNKIWVVTDNANPETSTTYSDMLGIPYTQPFFGRDASPSWEATNESGTPNTYFARVREEAPVAPPMSPMSDTKHYLIYPYLSGLTTNPGDEWAPYANDYRNPSTLDSFNAGSRGWYDASEYTVSWWDTSWSRRRKIKFDNSAQSEDLLYFPVLIKLTTSRVDYNYVQPDGDDIRFVDSDDFTELYFEVEKWTDNGDSYFWVKVPQIDANPSDDFIYVYYGNEDVDTSPYKDAAQVWNGDPLNSDDDFKMVHHLEENVGSANAILDSTSNGNHGTPYSDTTITNLYTDSGHIDGADAFDGTDDSIDVLNNNSSLNVGDVFSLTCWAKRNGTGEATLHSKFWGNYYSWKVYFTGTNDLELYLRNTDSSYESVTGPQVTDTTNWHYIAARSDGSQLKLSFDDQTFTADKTKTIGYDSSNLKIGVSQFNTTKTGWFKGSIDEVRISNFYRSNAWIAAEFKSESDTFATYEGEETFSATADFFNEAEGCYAIDMSDDQKLIFDIHGISNTRYSPAFKIRNYRSLNDPQAVYVDGVLIDKGRHYTMSVIPFSAAWYSNGTPPNPPWWNASWGKRAPVPITYSGSDLTDWNYQVKVDVTYDADMDPNFEDIRFVDSTGSELHYWRETYTPSISAVFWVEVPTIPDGGKTIYMYYDNTGVSTTSSGPDTFEYFEDFESFTTGSVDGQDSWEGPLNGDTYAGTIEDTGAFDGTKQLEHSGSGNHSSGRVIDLGGDRLIDFRLFLITTGTSDTSDTQVKLYEDGGWDTSIKTRPAFVPNGDIHWLYSYDGNTYDTGVEFSENTAWVRVRIGVFNGGTMDYWIDDYQVKNDFPQNFSDFQEIKFYTDSNGGIRFDQVFIRRYCGSEPTTAVDPEESYSSATQLAAGGLTTSGSEYLTRSDNNYTLNFGTDEYLYLGSTSKFRGINVDLVSEVTGSGLDLAWKYWNGTGWADLEATPGFTDNTSNLTKDGTIYWTSDPTDWSKCSVSSGTELYYVRTSLATGSYDTAPQENLIKTDILLFQYMLTITGTTISLIGPTAVDLVDFKATGDGNAVRVEWETAQEINNMGFNLYRSTTKEGSYQKLNSSLIPGLMYSATGKRYTYHDRTVTKGQLYYYKLEDIDTSGKHTWHGPVCVDWDGDGIPDDWELAHGLDPTVDDGDLDYDNDGLTNYEEYQRGTDPFNPDTDGDGIPDGEEVGKLPTTPGGAGSDDGICVVSHDDKGMVLELKTSRFDSTNIDEGGTAYQRLTIPTYTHGLTDTVGSPELPLKGYWVDLPQGMGLELEVEEVKTQTSSGYLVYPVPEKIAEDEQVLEQFALDPQAYAVDDFTPTERVTKGTVAYLRDQKKAQVLFSPISFNPQAGDLRLHTLIRVRITYVPDQRSEMQPLGFGGARFGLAAVDPNWPPVGNQLYKITTTTEGIYRVSHDELAAAGMDTASIIHQNLHLYNRGAEVAIYVFDGGNGTFDPGDYLEFYGEELTTKYTNTNVYWLVDEDSPGLRMADIDGTPGAAPLAGDFPEVVHAEQDYPRGYWGLAPGDDSVDRWFWVDLLTFEKFVLPNSPQDFPIELPGVSTAGGTATVSVALRGFTTDKLHQMSLSINGTQIAQQSWEGQDEYCVEVDIDQGLLISGVNTVTIELVGTELDGLVLDWIEVGYLRTLDAVDDLLRFTSDPPALFVISDFTVDQDQLSVFDITNPLDVGRIQGFVVTPDGANFTLSFQGQGETADHTYIALGESQIRGALEIAPVTPPTLIDTQNGADYILITHRDIGWELDGTPAGWLSDLTEYRQSQGLRVMAVDIDEIYDGFNYGISDPQAVKDFISYAYHNWQPPAPQYVVLVGDTTFDPKGNFAPPGPGVPTYLGWTRHMGETAIDDWFVQIVGTDALGDLYLGRLPAADKNEASLMVRKIIDYEEAPKDQPWQKRLLLVADDREPIFEQMNEAIAGLIPADYTLIKGYLEDYKILPAIPEDLTKQMIAEINQGVLIVNYAGHGSTKFWADERIFSTTHIPGLSNDQRLPVMVLMTCLNGYFVLPTSRSLAEEMLLADGAGAVAAFAPTGMTDAQVQNILDQGLTEAVFQTGIVRLGEAVHAAKETLLVNTTGQEDTANSFSLMGDPAMTLPVESPSATSAPIVWGGGGGSGGGCFIASAAYGSFLDGHVHALRAFRDRWLISNPIGKYLIKAYYTTSPPAAGWIKQHENIQALTRIALVPIVAIAGLELNRVLTISLVLLLLISPLAWTHCLTKGRKRVIGKE